MITLFKILWVTLRNKPDQQFVNELYLHEQARHYRRHAGIHIDVPDGKYLSSTKHIKLR